MKKRIIQLSILVVIVLQFNSCSKANDLLDKNPDIDALQSGFKLSAAIGYSASIAGTAMKGNTLPPNVIVESTSSDSRATLMHIVINDDYPLPFNNDKNIGNITIAGIWGENNTGVITILFSNLNILGNQFDFFGVQTIPIKLDPQTGNIIAVYARQDIVISNNGNNSFLEMDYTEPQYNIEIDRTNGLQPSDAYVAISQNIWYVNINQQNTPSIYDDLYTVNGGGQITSAGDEFSGFQFHALVNTKFIYDQCPENPFDGDALIQHFGAGDKSIDLGNIFLQFHQKCDGEAHVKTSFGKYLKYLQRDVNLNFN